MSDADLLIVGGGPAGMMAGLLFARAGLKTLRLFFEAVLQRSAAARAQPAPPPPPAVEPVDPTQVVERGWIRNRPYARFADGSVEIETLLGIRRFASFADAEDFVGS